MTYQPGDLLADTRVEADPAHPGRLFATISPAWNLVYVFGGTAMAVAVSAARASLSQPSFQLLSATCTFLSPISAGRVALDTRTLRSGKGAEQISVDLSQAESEAPSLHLVATFGPKRALDDALQPLSFPDAVPPEAIPEYVPRPGASMLRVPYYRSVETRNVPRPADRPRDHGGASWLGWFRFRKTPRRADGLLDPLAYVAACDMIGPAFQVARGREAARVFIVSLEISLHFYESTDSEWLLQDARIYQAGDGYVSGIVNLWDQHKRLVGHALQRAVLRPRAF